MKPCETGLHLFRPLAIVGEGPAQSRDGRASRQSSLVCRRGCFAVSGRRSGAQEALFSAASTTELNGEPSLTTSSRRPRFGRVLVRFPVVLRVWVSPGKRRISEGIMPTVGGGMQELSLGRGGGCGSVLLPSLPPQRNSSEECEGRRRPRPAEEME